MFIRDGVLLFFDHRVKELHYLPAVDTDQMIM